MNNRVWDVLGLSVLNTYCCIIIIIIVIYIVVMDISSKFSIKQGLVSVNWPVRWFNI